MGSKAIGSRAIQGAKIAASVISSSRMPPTMMVGLRRTKSATLPRGGGAWLGHQL
jgi:hypothetical protein